jgi:hypothetical protein
VKARPERLEDFYNYHAGETCVIAGVGPNLKLTPPEWFNYPSFSVNTIYLYEGWKPDYYVAVDLDMLKLYNTDVVNVYQDVTKFIPTPDFDELRGDNFFRFVHRDDNYHMAGQYANQPKALTGHGIGYKRVMDAVFQIAWYMGFTTLLLIGVQHKQDTRNTHFWGFEPRDPANTNFEHETNGLAHFTRSLMGEGIRVLNISEDTYVPETVVPRDDWRKYAQKVTA